jgi:murein DD-endopeptidase MepM/ murein hydrolase activator NlpD
MRVKVNGNVVMDWASVTPGQYNQFNVEFAAYGHTEILIDFMCPFALVNSGFFCDAWSLVAVDAPPPDPDPIPGLTEEQLQHLWQLSIQEQTNRGIWLNPAAGLQREVRDDDLWMVHREIYPQVDGQEIPITAGEHPDTPGIRWLYLWIDGKPYRWNPDKKKRIIHMPADTSRITQYFGDNPEYYKQFGLPGHEGLDFVVPAGGPYYAVNDGLVVHASDRRWSNDKPSAYGWHVVIEHGDYATVYAHAMPDLPVEVGQLVTPGTIVGRSGNTGNSSGYHLHFGMLSPTDTGNGYPMWRYGQPIDPEPYL